MSHTIEHFRKRIRGETTYNIQNRSDHDPSVDPRGTSAGLTKGPGDGPAKTPGHELSRWPSKSGMHRPKTVNSVEDPHKSRNL